MREARQSFLVIVGIFFASQTLFCGLSFSSQQSTLELINSAANVYFNRDLTIRDGRIVVPQSLSQLKGAALTGSDISLKLEEVDTVYHINTTYSCASSLLNLTGNQTLILDAGSSLISLISSGLGNRVISYADLMGTFSIANSNSNLTVGIFRPFLNRIALNGGTLILEDNLSFGSTNSLTGVVTGSGFIDCLNNYVGLHDTEFEWTTTITFLHAMNLSLNSRTRLSGTWTFGPAYGNSVIDGNGNELNLTQGGNIYVMPGHTLFIKNIAVSGLDPQWGKFILQDSLSTLSCSNVTLVLNNNYTVTQGNVCFTGAHSTVNTYDYFMTFTNNGKMILNGVRVYADAMENGDDINLRPLDPDGINFIVLDDNGGLSGFNGVLRRPPIIPLFHNITIDSMSYVMTASLHSNYRNQFIFRGDRASNMTFDGNGLPLTFGRVKEQCIYVFPGKKVTFKNVLLDGLLPEQITLAPGASLYFGDGAYLRLRDNFELATTWSFSGQTIIDGMGKQLQLKTNGQLLNVNGSLLLKDLLVYGLTSTSSSWSNIQNMDDASTCSLSNVSLFINSVWEQAKGIIDIIGDVRIAPVFGSGIINYTSKNPFNINSYSTLILDSGMSFSYATISARSDRLVFKNNTSSIWLNNASIQSTFTGAFLQTGRIEIDGLSSLIGFGRNKAEALVLDDSLTINIQHGARIELDGFVLYK